MEHVKSLADQLLAEGVQYAYGITGSGLSLRLIEELHGRGILYYPVRHEAAAALMAGASCRSGETRAISITIKGPGFANLVPGILSNHYEGRPAISVSEAYGRDAPEWRKHKRLGHFQMISQVTKGAAEVGGESVHRRHLFELAKSECPGPVHLDLCPTPGEYFETFRDDAVKTYSGDLTKLLERIAASSNPVVILGSLASRKFPSVDWNSLMIPVVTTAAGKGAIDENSEFSGGVITGEVSELSPEGSILTSADLAIGIGLRNDEVVKAAPLGPEVLIIDEILGDHHSGFEASVVLSLEDAGSAVESVFRELKNKSWGNDVIHRARLALDTHLGGNEWQLAHAFTLFQASLPSDTVLVLDTGFFCTVGETVWKAASPSHFCGSSVGRFMGVSIPSAIGVSISEPGRPVLCVAGDGGLPPYIAEIEMAVSEHLPIIFANFADGRYGSVAAFSGDTAAVHRAVDLGSVDRWKLALALGCPAHRVSDVKSLESLLTAWTPSSGPLFIQCEFEPLNYARLAKQLR